jgi:chromosomal replication initiation ATPase DnaA
MSKGMINPDKQTWTRVRERLRAEVGDDIYLSWFARMELESSEGETVKLSVPTRFLKSWIQSHYAEKVLTCWQSENPGYSRIELIVRSSMLRPPAAKSPPVDSPAPLREMREAKTNGGEIRVTTSMDLAARRLIRVSRSRRSWWAAATLSPMRPQSKLRRAGAPTR